MRGLTEDSVDFPRPLVALVARLMGMAALVLFGLPAQIAGSEIVDVDAPDGCYASVADSVGLEGGLVTPGTITLDVPGPVVQVRVEWSGEFTAAPPVPGLGLDVDGTTGTVTADQTFTDPASASTTAYTFLGDATALFDDGPGTYTVGFVAPPGPSAPTGGDWYGATVTVIYDTAPCGEIVELIWNTGVDHYFGGGPSVTTDTIVFEFAQPLPRDVDATVRVAHGGADSAAGECRASAIWAATGNGSPPAVLVNPDGTPAHPGADETVINPFSPPNQPCPLGIIRSPVTGITGGSVGTEFGLITLEVLIPAGSTWLALQLESPTDNNGVLGRPEDGAWAGGGLLSVPGTLVPGLSLQHTVVDGAGGSCPGVEGTDERLTAPLGEAVTYCFRVINTGNVPLSPVTLDNPDLGITEDDMTLVAGDDTVPLAPGGELVYVYESTIDGDLVSTVTAAGTPSTPTGIALGVPDVTAVNDAAVDVEAVVDDTPDPTTPPTDPPPTDPPTDPPTPTTAPTATAVPVDSTATAVPHPSGMLPRTGAHSGGVLPAVALVVVGGLLVFGGRRTGSAQRAR